MTELYVYPLLFVGIFCREVIAPASQNKCDRRWLILSLGLAVSTVITTLIVGYWFSSHIRRNAFFPSATNLSAIEVASLSFLITSFIFYWWHRLTHHSDLFWRLFHQLHHSATRVEALTAFYSHPLDSAAAVLISSFSSYIVLGASPLAAAIALFMTGAFDLFVHSDIKTRPWLGYFIQRPEMHTVHHQRGHHAQNYGLPLWDILFGTWSNPEVRVEHLGFDQQYSTRVTDMLLCRDVHQSAVN